MAEHSKEITEEQQLWKVERARADEQEALSLKHSRSLSILALTSGKFALFFPWSNDGGMPLAKIAEWAELEAEVRAWRDKAEPQQVTQRRLTDAINLEELFAESGVAKETGDLET